MISKSELSKIVVLNFNFGNFSFENIAASPTSKLHFHSTEAKVLEDSEIIFVGFQNELKCQKVIIH